MDMYDKSKVGKKIARGGDREVHMYGDDKVIKFSKLSSLTGSKLHNKYIHDYLVCKKYFGKYIVETENISNLSEGSNIEIQPFINGEMLQKKHSNNPYVKEQLREIVLILNKMKQDDSPIIDLLGNYGMFHPRLSNIIVDSSNNLRIIDAVLLEGKTVMPFGIILELFIPLVKVRQKYLLYSFLK